MKSTVFRSLPIVLALMLGLALFLSGCEAGLFGKLDANNSSGLTELQLDIPGGAGAKVLTHSAGDTAFVRVFDSSRVHKDIGAGTSYEVALTWDATNTRWAGSIDLSAIAGDVTVLAYVQNGSSQQIYRGSATKTISDLNRTETISLAAGTAYVAGDPGPAGGWIYYDKGSYSDGWRYLEATPSNLSASWSGIDLEPGYHLDGSGNVENVSHVIEMRTTDWYWGPNTNPLNTETTLGKGNENTVKLVTADGVSGVTPKVKKGNGRPIPATGTDLVRRMVATTTGALSVNGKDDWFIPSSLELGTMYTNIKSVSGTGLTTGKYWSSTEDSTLNAGAYSGLYIDFGVGALSTVVDERVQLYKVRPSRRF